MKKTFKTLLIIIIGFFIIINVIDLAAIYFNKKPLIILNSEGKEKYSGLFYNTYNCNDKVYIKFKTTKFSCPVVKNYKIVDKSKEIKNFTCSEALDEIYRNEDYSYNLTCLKESYVVVEYKDGKEETIKEALKNNKIEIKDLDLYEIEYVKVPLKHEPLDTSSEITPKPSNNEGTSVETKPEINTGTETKPETGSVETKPQTSTGSEAEIKPSTSNDTQIISQGINKKPITKPEVGTTSKDIVVIDKSFGQYCAQAIEYFYQNYYFTCVKSHSVYVKVDGKEYLLKYALNNGIVTMQELEAAGYKFNKNNNYNFSDR